MDPAEELQQLYLEQTTKLARITAALGIEGDRPTEELVLQVRHIMRDRQTLLTVAKSIHASAQPSLGQVYIHPSQLWQLENAIEMAKRTFPQ